MWQNGFDMMDERNDNTNISERCPKCGGKAFYRKSYTGQGNAIIATLR